MGFHPSTALHQTLLLCFLWSRGRAVTEIGAGIESAKKRRKCKGGYSPKNHAARQLKRQLEKQRQKKWSAFQELVAALDENPDLPRASAKEVLPQTQLTVYRRHVAKAAAPRLVFDAEVVDLVATLFEKDEEFGGLGTSPDLVACRGSEEIEDLEPGNEQFSDEEEPDSYYHEIRLEAMYGLVSDLIAQCASF